MKVLVTGGSGFLGGPVLRALARHGIPAVAVGRTRPAEDVDFIAADLLDSPDLQALLSRAGATHLLHLAWYAEHGKYWTSPLNLRWVEASVRLVEAFCDAGGRHVVAAGTCAEYDWSHGYCREDTTPADPATLYGVAKDAARRLVMAVCAGRNVPCAWGRIFLPYGPGEAPARLIPSLISTFRGEREPFGVNAAAWRDFLHVDDLADAFVTLLRAGQGGVYNVSSGQPVALGDLVRTLAGLLGADPEPVLRLATARPGEPPLLVGDNARLAALRWRPAVTLSSGLRRTLERDKVADE